MSAKIKINFDKLNYMCGEQVNGTIALKVKKPGNASMIFMQLKGKEKVVLWERVSKHRDATRWVDGREEHYQEQYYDDKEIKDKKKAYNYSFKIFEFPGHQMQQGQWLIPFSFVLPMGLPTSFDHEWYDHGECEATIKYTVKAKLLDDLNETLEKEEKKFFINQPPHQNVHGDKKSSSKEVKSYCCIGRGDVKITGYTERNAYMCGEEIYMVAEVENNMSQRIGNVHGDFVRVLKVKCKNKHDTIEQNYEGPSGGSIKAGEDAKGQDAMRLSCSTKATINKGKKGTTYDTTCDGKLINCDYYVQVRLEPDICCHCSGDPIVRFPVHMTVPQITNLMDQGDDWGGDVQTMPGFVANFSPEFAVAEKY